MMVVPNAVTELMGPITGNNVINLVKEDCQGSAKGQVQTIDISMLEPMFPFPLATGWEVRDIP
jgi:hypothetical protein